MNGIFSGYDVRSVMQTDWIKNIYLNFYVGRLFEGFGVNISSNIDDMYKLSTVLKKYIEKYIYDSHIPDVLIYSKKDALVFLDATISYLRKKLRMKIAQQDIKELRKELFLLAAYEVEFHSRINELIDGGATEFVGKHEIENIVFSLAKNKKCVYQLRGLNAEDNNAIQLLIQECMTLNNIYCEGGQLSQYIFIEMYQIAISLTNLIGMRWLVDVQNNNNAYFSITDGKIEFKEDLQWNNEEFVRRMEIDVEEYEKTYPKNIIKILDNNFYKSYGFKIESLGKIASSMPIYMDNNTYVTVSNYETIIQEISMVAQCERNEANNLFEFLCLKEYDNRLKDNHLPEKDSNRVFEKCIMQHGDDLYLYSYIMIGFAYIILSRKLKFNLIDGCKKSNSKIIEKKIKNEFEKTVYNKLKSLYKVTLYDQHKLDNGVVLPRQIDVIYYDDCGETLYVVECKDIAFKFTPLGIKTDVKKEKEFIGILKENITNIKNNKAYFETKYGIKVSCVKGRIVYRTTNYITEKEQNYDDIDILSYKQLKEVIEKKTK